MGIKNLALRNQLLILVAIGMVTVLSVQLFYYFKFHQMMQNSESAGALVDQKPTFPGSKVPQHTANICHFVECVLGRETPIFAPEQGVDMIKILSAIYESAELGREIRL